MVRRRFGLLLGLAGLLAASASAQSNAPYAVPYTLHVNVRLLQVPTLVLSSSLQPLPPVDRGQFAIRLDGGPKFRPSSARLEGDDPLTVVILLDMAGGEEDLIPQLERDFSSWIRDSLRPTDHVAIYGLDCALVHTHGYLSASSALLQPALENVLHAPEVHGTKSRPACGRSVRLWDSLAVITADLAGVPGRRVILAVSEGFDGRSLTKLTRLEEMDVEESVTIFGLSEEEVETSEWTADRFSTLCQRTGGLEMTSSNEHLAANLRRIVNLVRGRYILEFTEPSNVTAGSHQIEVTIDHTLAFIRSAGVSAVLDDPAWARDPTVLPRDTSKAPVMGDKKPKDLY